MLQSSENIQFLINQMIRNKHMKLQSCLHIGVEEGIKRGHLPAEAPIQLEEKPTDFGRCRQR